MPDDAALLLAHTVLGGLHAEVLVHTRQLLHATVEEHEVVHQLQQPMLGASLEEVFVQLVATVVGFVFLPCQKVLLGRSYGPVLHPLGVVASEDDLDGGEERLVELLLLVGEQLPYAVADGDATVLEFDDTESDPVHVQHKIGPPLKNALEGDLFGNREVVLLGLPPVNKMHCLRDLACLGLHGHPVAEQAVDRLVVAVQRAAGVACFCAQLVERGADLRALVATLS